MILLSVAAPMMFSWAREEICLLQSRGFSVLALSISADVLQHVLLNFLLAVLSAKAAVVRSDLTLARINLNPKERESLLVSDELAGDMILVEPGFRIDIDSLILHVDGLQFPRQSFCFGTASSSLADLRGN